MEYFLLWVCVFWVDVLGFFFWLVCLCFLGYYSGFLFSALVYVEFSRLLHSVISGLLHSALSRWKDSSSM